MSKRMKRNFHFLKALETAPPTMRKAMLKTGDDELMCSICEICSNILQGVVKLTPNQKRDLMKYKWEIRALQNRDIKMKKKKRMLIQKGGFLPLVLAPALSLLASLLGETIAGAIRK